MNRTWNVIYLLFILFWSRTAIPKQLRVRWMCHIWNYIRLLISDNVVFKVTFETSGVNEAKRRFVDYTKHRNWPPKSLPIQKWGTGWGLGVLGAGRRVVRSCHHFFLYRRGLIILPVLSIIRLIIFLSRWDLTMLLKLCTDCYWRGWQVFKVTGITWHLPRTRYDLIIYFN